MWSRVKASKNRHQTFPFILSLSRARARSDVVFIFHFQLYFFHQAECPECQQDMLRQTHTFNSDGVPVAPSSNHIHIHATRRSSSIRSSGKLKVCSTHRSRALPGEGGLPGLDDELDLGLGMGLVGGAVGGGVGGGIGEGGDEFRPRRGMGKTRKRQLSSKTKPQTKYEGGYRHGGCCSVQ